MLDYVVLCIAEYIILLPSFYCYLMLLYMAQYSMMTNDVIYLCTAVSYVISSWLALSHVMLSILISGVTFSVHLTDACLDIVGTSNEYAVDIRAHENAAHIHTHTYHIPSHDLFRLYDFLHGSNMEYPGTTKTVGPPSRLLTQLRNLPLWVTERPHSYEPKTYPFLGCGRRPFYEIVGLETRPDIR